MQQSKHRTRHAACGTGHPRKGTDRATDTGEAENQSVRTEYGNNKQMFENEFVFIVHCLYCITDLQGTKERIVSQYA